MSSFSAKRLKLVVLFTIVSLMSIEHGVSATTSTDERMSVVWKVQAVLSTPDSKIDLARAKLTFDKIADPAANLDAALGQIQKMTADIRLLAGPNATRRELVTALRTYLYESGDWNGHAPYQYDLSDPLGTRLPTRLLSYYLATRRGE
jgi:hypothetical protein